MEEIISWKIPGLFKADAGKVAAEIKSLGENATPEGILEYARNENTELHKCYEWDDTVAAEKWRKHTSRIIAGNIQYIRTDGETSTPAIRYLHMPEYETVYRPVTSIVVDQDAYATLLETAMNELRAFKKKYHTLSELSEIFELIK